MMMPELLALIDKVDVVSFDVFDTLLSRTYLNPVDVFEHLEEDSNSVGFAKMRVNADFESIKSAQRDGRDATLDDAYSFLPKSLGRLKDRELDFERRGLVSNVEMVGVWNKAGELGKKRVIASDMYLPQSFLEEVLRLNGIDGWDGFYVSNACGVRKSDGRLFAKILQDFAVPANRMLHIGDNALSDGEIPRRLGISTYKVDRVVDVVCAKHAFVKRFLAINSSLWARRLVSAVCLGWHNAYPNDAPLWTRIGGFLGGVMGASYVRFLVQEARARKLDRVLFVARDGFVLQKLFNVAAPEIRTDYVYAPRHVMYSNDGRVRAEYHKYIAGLGILEEERVGVVDTVTRNYSGQRLIASALDRPVAGFAFFAFEKPNDGAAFCYTPNASLRWYLLVETLFMSHEAPIVAIANLAPVYKNPVPEEECRRQEAFTESVDANLKVATFLLKAGVAATPSMMIDFVEAYLDSSSQEELALIAEVKNEIDPKKGLYVPVLGAAHWTRRWVTVAKVPIYRREYRREGLKAVIRDRLFGLWEFRKTEEPL